MDSTYIQFVVIILLFFILYLLKVSFPKYLEKKAENLAQSEDIQKLTRLVKEVEFKFEERTQHLRAQLELSNHYQLGLHNEERSSVINLHKQTYDYYNFLTDCSLNGIDFRDNEKLFAKINEKGNLADGLFAVKTTMMLFLNESVENEIEDIIMDISNSFNHFSLQYIKYLQELSNLNIVYPSFEDSVFLTIYTDKRNDLSSKYYSKLQNFIETTGPLLLKLTRELKKYLSFRTAQNK